MKQAPFQTRSKLDREIPSENNLPLSLLLDTGLIKSTLGNLNHDKHSQMSDIKIDFVRYNPGVSCIICYNVTIKDDRAGTQAELIFYGHAFPEEQFRKTAERLDGQSWISGSILDSPQPVESLQTIFYEFPNDGGMPGLKLLAESENLKQLVNGSMEKGWMPFKSSLSNPAVIHRLRYKPENRYIARFELQNKESLHSTNLPKSILIKFERDRNSEKAYRLSVKLFNIFKSDSRINLPKPLFFNPEYNLQAFEWVEAEKLSELLRGRESELWVKRAAKILSALHDYKISGLPRLDETYFEKRIRHTADFLACASDDLKKMSEEIAWQLNAITLTVPDNAAGLVHGDFHQGQLLVADRRDTVLDFSRCHWGDRTADIGNFLAQLRYWHMIGRLNNIGALEQLFIEAYERPDKIRDLYQRVKFWKTIGLFELAMREFRRLKPDWPIMCEKLLQECLNTLDA